MTDFTPAKFIETPQGDLIDPMRIESVKYWPPYKNETDHRTQIRTVEGGIWEIYRGPSEQEAIAIRDEMKATIKATLRPWPLPNVWLGVSAERQQEWDERKEHLRTTPAAVRFASFEPLLGEIVEPRPMSDFIEWAIVGGESGPKARPMHPDWVRSLRDQCAAAGTAFFLKQWGEFAPLKAYPAEPNGQFKTLLIDVDGKHIADIDAMRSDFSDRARYVYRVGKKRAGRLLDGIEHNAMPERCG